ncbi:BCL (B-Cell lymphoma) [Pristimantis euphronides]
MVPMQDEALDEVSLQDEDSFEFRMLMVYAQRTLPISKYQELMRCTPVQKEDGAASNGDGHRVGDSPSLSSKKDKKKSLRRRLTPKCLRPVKAEEGEALYSPKEPTSRCSLSIQEENQDKARIRGLVQRLATIVRKLEKQDQERMEFTGLKRVCSVQGDGDGEEEDVIENIVEIMRSEGDKLNNEMLREQNFLERFPAFLSYGFYQRLTETYVAQMVPALEAEEAEQSSKIALCLHATTTLATLDNHPMNRMFGFGARYLKENYSQWIQEHGGWEKVIKVPDVQEEEPGED